MTERTDGQTGKVKVALFLKKLATSLIKTRNDYALDLILHTMNYIFE
jgi:hypothetical protein